MKIKRLLAGIVACAMAVSAMAITASAAITNPKPWPGQENWTEQMYVVTLEDAGILEDEINTVYGIEVDLKITENVKNDDGEDQGTASGQLLFFNSWDGDNSVKKGFGPDGWADIVVLGDGEQTIKYTHDTPVYTTTNGSAIFVECWGGEFSVEDVRFIYGDPSAEEPEGEEPEGEEPEGEEPEGEEPGEDEDDEDEEVVNPIIGKTFIQNQGGSWDWYDSGDTEFEGEGSTIDVSLDLTNPEIELYDPVEDWEDTPNLGIQIADVRVDEAGKSTEFSYKVDSASIVVAGETIDLDISEYAEEVEVVTLGKTEEWGISGGDTMISLKDQVEALADEAGVSYMEYLATIDSLDATITLISYSGAVVDTPAEEDPAEDEDPAETPDAKNPSTGAGGIVAVVGMSALALTAVTVSRKRK